MKTIKIIDLYIKIANGEEVPKKIKYHGILYRYNNKEYYCGDSEEYYNDALLLPHIENTKKFLNEEVEIIEDTPEYENKIKELEEELEKEKKAWKDMLDSRDKLCSRISKAIEYIEELYTRYIADYSDIERLEKILKGEENGRNE